MRLISYGPFGSERAAFLDGDKIIDLEQAMKAAGAERPVSDMRLFLEQSDWRSTLDRAHAARTKVTPVAGQVRLGAPVPVPRTLIIAGANTKSHIAEAGAVLGKAVGSREPMLLAKATSTEIFIVMSYGRTITARSRSGITDRSLAHISSPTLVLCRSAGVLLVVAISMVMAMTTFCGGTTTAWLRYGTTGR